MSMALDYWVGYGPCVDVDIVGREAGLARYHPRVASSFSAKIPAVDSNKQDFLRLVLTGEGGIAHGSWSKLALLLTEGMKFRPTSNNGEVFLDAADIPDHLHESPTWELTQWKIFKRPHTSAQGVKYKMAFDDRLTWKNRKNLQIVESGWTWV